MTSSALVLAAGFLVLFMSGGTRFAVGLTFKPIVDELGWGRSELGLAVALFQVVSAAGMFIVGYLGDRTGPRRVLAGGIFVSAIGIGPMSAMAAPWHALVLYAVVYAIGSGAASTIPVRQLKPHPITHFYFGPSDPVHGAAIRRVHADAKLFRATHLGKARPREAVCGFLPVTLWRAQSARGHSI